MKHMTLSIVSVAIITVFGGPSYTHGQPSPDDTNSWCTNCPPYTNEWSNPIYPSNALQWAVLNSTNFGLFNTVPHHLYEIQNSSNLLDWSLLVPAFTNLGTSTVVMALTNDVEFLRAKEVTYQTIYTNANAQTSYSACAGSYIGVATYRWLDINTNTIVHTFADGEGLNRNIQAVGNYGHVLCGNGSITMSNLSSTSWTFSIFFSNSIPSNYPAVLGGFAP